MLASPAQN